MFDTTYPLPRADISGLRLRRLKKLSKKLHNFAIPGSIHEAYAPESEYVRSRQGRRVKAAVVTKKKTRPIYTGGRPTRYYETEGGIGKEPFEGRPRGAPAFKYKALRPGVSYAHPGMQWQTVRKEEIQPGEKFAAQPVYETKRLNTRQYLRAKFQTEVAPIRTKLLAQGAPESDIRETERLAKRNLFEKFKQSVQEEAQAESGKRLSARKDIIAHGNKMLEREMQHHRDWMAGELRESRAIIQARGAHPLSARAHPERMIAYKQRLEELAKQRQATSRAVRQGAVERLRGIAARGLQKMGGYAEEEALGKAGRSVGILTDIPYYRGGEAPAEISGQTLETLSEVFQKGSKSVKPVTPERLRRLKGRLDVAYERGDPTLRSARKAEIVRSGALFKGAPEVAKAIKGYPHLRKLGLGLGAAGILGAGALAIRARRKRDYQLSSKRKEIRFAELPPEAERLLNKVSQRIWQEEQRKLAAGGGGPVGSIIRSPRMRRQRVLTRYRKLVYKGALKKALGESGAIKYQKLYKEKLGDIKELKGKLRAQENITEGALSAQEEAHKKALGQVKQLGYEKGVTAGTQAEAKRSKAVREEQIAAAQSKMSKESDIRARRLKWIAAGGVTAGGIGGYALGRSDRKAHRRYAVAQFGSKLRLIQFQNDDGQDPQWLQKWSHRQLYGRSYATKGQVQKIKKYAGRTHRLLRDVNIQRQGLPNVDVRGRPRTPEWEKPWVAGLVTSAGIGAAILGARQGLKFVRGAPLESRIGQLREGFLRGDYTRKVPGLQKVGGFVHGVKSDIVRWRDKPLKEPTKWDVSKFNPKTGKPKSPRTLAREEEEAAIKEHLEKIAKGKVHKTDFGSRLKELRFAQTLADWDISTRSPGSAVVHAPGSQRRQRRQKEWYERKANQRRLWEGGIGGTALLGLGGLLYAKGKGYRIGYRTGKEATKIIGSTGKPVHYPSGEYLEHAIGPFALVRKKSIKPGPVEFSAIEKVRGKLQQVYASDPKTGEPSATHDITIGALEGGAAYPLSDYLIRRFAPKGSGLGRKALVGGVVGGLATGLIGVGVSNIIRGKHKIGSRRQQMQSKLKEIRFQFYPNPMRLPSRTLVARDRYIKQIHERDINRANRYYVHATAVGAGLGALFRGKAPIQKAVAIGAASGLAAQKAARLVGYAKRDPFGERTIAGKRIEKAPTVIGAGGIGATLLYRAYKGRKLFSAKNRLIRFEEAKRKHRLLAGAALASVAIPQARGAFKFTRAALNPRIGKFTGKGTHYGKMVADYLEGSQQVLNRGPIGKLAGVVLRNPESAPVKKAVQVVGGGSSGVNKLNRAHFSSFRASPAEALDSWAGEVYQDRINAGRHKVAELHHQQYGKVVEHMRDLMGNKGFNEIEAIRQVSAHPKHQEFFQRLAAFKKPYFSRYAGISSGVSAVPITAGAAVAATKKKSGTAS